MKRLGETKDNKDTQAMHSDKKKSVLTTGQVARICHVAPRTVSKWFDTGQLRGYRIPGSRDRRIPIEHLHAFMRAHGIPLDALDGGVCRVLIVGRDPQQAEPIIQAVGASGRYDLQAAANEFEAGVLAQQFRPHAIVLDVGEDLQRAAETCRRIKATPALQPAKVIAAANGMTEANREHLRGWGFDLFLNKPYSPAQLQQAVEEATNLLT